MDHHHTARVLAATRVAIGAVAFAAPGLATRPLLRGSASSPASKLLTRAFGVRDMALGLGTLRALQDNRDPKSWVQLAALCDAGDALATAAGLRRLPVLPSLAALASASTAAVSGWRASAHLGSATGDRRQ